MRAIRLSLLFITPVLFSAACGDGSVAPHAMGPATLSIYLTDQPGDVRSAVVTIAEVYLQGSDGRTVLMDTPFTVDLVPLATTSTVLVENVEVEAGYYQDLRFVITGGYVTVEQSDGTTKLYTSAPDYPGLLAGAAVDGELQLPSFASSGLKVEPPDGGFTVPETGMVTWVVDFDVEQSFGHAAGGADAWVMHPVLRAADIDHAEVTAPSITAGQSHTCALAAGGTAFCWGANEAGQLGDGSVTMRSAPWPVSHPSGVVFVRIAADGAHTCALTPAGEAYCWGANLQGQIGDGTNAGRLMPTGAQPPPGVTFTEVTADGSHSCALTPTQAAYCWGANLQGQLGDGTSGNNRFKPVEALTSAGETWVGLSAGGSHTCGLTPSGTVYCSGVNNTGALGDGTTTNKSTPVAVAIPSGETFTSVSAGGFHTCAVTPEGAAYCWGSNSKGQLGDGTTTNHSTPVAVAIPAGETFASVSAGGFHTCAVTPEGAAYCWGSNQSGQLGDGNTDDQPTPVQVLLPAGVTLTSVSAGGSHTCGLTPSASIYCWGSNQDGQLGDGSRVNQSMPKQVSLP